MVIAFVQVVVFPHAGYSTERRHTMSVLTINGGQVEIIELHCDLAAGSLAGCRAKFAESQRRQVLAELLDSIDPGAPGLKLYRGDWRKGEVEITGLVRVISNRFWTEPEWAVLFPPKPGKTEPAPGTYRWIQWNSGVDNGAAVLCLTPQQEIVLVNEFKHAAREWVLGIPRGLRKPDELLEDTGRREANEEAGVSITEQSKVVDLGPVWVDTGALRSRPTIMAITNVAVDDALRNRDVSESAMTTLVLPIERIEDLIRSRKLSDSFTEVALARARLHGLL